MKLLVLFLLVHLKLSQEAYKLELVYTLEAGEARNMSSTSKEHLENILKQDTLRAQAIHDLLHRPVLHSLSDTSTSLPLSSGGSFGTGVYVARVGIGTPPMFVYLVMDTGSDITWLQCAPCNSCYFQADPLFSPLNSSSYELVHCSSTVCQELTSSTCESSERGDGSCPYYVNYLDKSSSSGALSKEIFTLAGGRRLQNKSIVFGCGNTNVGLFRGYSGLLGFGRGKYSFISQLPEDIGSSFSYCMVNRQSPKDVSSSLVLGSHEEELPFSTPLLVNPRSRTHYFVNMVGISVNERMLDIPGSLLVMDEDGVGGTVVDSGTTLTHLPSPAYAELREAFVRAIGESKLAKEEVVKGLDTCFTSDDETFGKVPRVVLHFQGPDAEMKLERENVGVAVSGTGVWCLAFVGRDMEFAILGNVQQQTFRVEIDLEKSRMSFSAPYSC